ncbi:MAG: hypothetical protein HY044_03755 [Candidatus Woesebacteria bacterium]|nr:MAG: hypothetical protein HY044_03755 [Candidatus Woesebacteria bacterium]
MHDIPEKQAKKDLELMLQNLKITEEKMQRSLPTNKEQKKRPIIPKTN